jgi:hypothetical protein
MQSTQDEILSRMERIRSVFLNTQLFYSENNSIDELLAYLDNTEPIYRSIAYESASMSIAIKQIEAGAELSDWIAFVDGPAMKHKAQAYIGLGWSIAKLGLSFSNVVKDLDSNYFHRVADGCGYYDGSFKGRPTILSQQLPEYLPTSMIPAYNQGVGRSLWYSCKADIDKLVDKIKSFSENRLADLWRGAGIAVAYIGGCDEEDLKALFKNAGENGLQLALGAALAVRSRTEANTMIPDTERCCRMWYELAKTHENEIPSLATENNTDYIDWLSKAEQKLIHGI